MELGRHERERDSMVGEIFKYVKAWENCVLAKTPILYGFPIRVDEEYTICAAYDLYTIYETRSVSFKDMEKLSVSFKDMEEFLEFSLFQRPNWVTHMDPFKKQASIWTHATATEGRFYD